MIRIVSVTNKYRTVLRIPLYPSEDDIFKSLFGKQDGMPIEQAVTEDIQLSVDDVCRIAKALYDALAISMELEPTPEIQELIKR